MSFQIVNPEEATCPFCGAAYIQGKTREGDLAVLHVIPACEQYEELGLSDYLAAIAAIFKHGRAN